MSHSQTSVLQYVYRGLIALAAIAFIIRFRSNIFTSILPFFIAFILAGLIEQGIHSLHAHLRMPRSAAVVAVFVLVMAAGGYITTLVTAKILSELVDMSVQASNYQATIVQIGTDILNRITEVADEELLPPQIRNAITNAIETFSELGEQFAKSAIQSILDTFVALPGVLVVIVITGIATYFIAKDREIISKNLFRLAPSRWRGPLTAAQDHIILDLVRFLKAQFVLFLITTAVAAVGLGVLPAPHLPRYFPRAATAAAEDTRRFHRRTSPADAGYDLRWYRLFRSPWPDNWSPYRNCHPCPAHLGLSSRSGRRGECRGQPGTRGDRCRGAGQNERGNG